jgi:hypothetical protein
MVYFVDAWVAAHDPPSHDITLDGPYEDVLAPPERPPRTRHSRKQPDGHIPRPPNAFILFRSSFIRSQRVSPDVETSHSTLSKIIGLTWQNLPADERRVWHAKARQAVEEHRRQFPQYAFRPSHRRTRGGDAEKDKEKDGKRKVREHVVDDPTRCAKIAELLGEGKHGRILDAAMQEFDRQRRPSVVARFEPPITATAYRRASSAPAPDTEPPLAFLCSTPIVTQRRRSSSSGPSSRSREPEEAPEEVHMETQPGTLDNSADPNSAVDSFISPWTQDPETEYFVSVFSRLSCFC